MATCLASATLDTGEGEEVFGFVGCPPIGWDPFGVVGLLIGPSSSPVGGDAALSLSGVLEVGVETSERTSSSFLVGPPAAVPVFVVFVVLVAPVPPDFADPSAAPDDSLSKPVAPDLAVAGFAPEATPETADPLESPDSSAHARPLLQPVTMAALTPKATAKPATRPTYASLRMATVYRRQSLGVVGNERPAE